MMCRRGYSRLDVLLLLLLLLRMLLLLLLLQLLRWGIRRGSIFG
jgi:hypothetical protein